MRAVMMYVCIIAVVFMSNMPYSRSLFGTSLFLGLCGAR